MSITLKSFSNAVLASLLSLGALAPLSAQLDPKLQVTPSDFSDLYQGVTATGILKPEVVLVMDFSTSTNRIMFHPLFPNNDSDEEQFDDNSNYYSVYVTINGSSPYKVSQVGFGRSALNTTVRVSSTNFTIGGDRTLVSGTTYTNTLIKPDGTEVTEADVQATVANANIYRSNQATPASYALNWVRCASHVRMRCTYGGVTRDVDFPINWAVLDASATGHPLTPTKVTNPTSQGGDGLSYDIDSVYIRTTNGGNYSALRELGTGKAYAEIGSSVDNVRLYRSRYIQWVFWGKDASGAYYIPDAITAGNCVDPDSIAYGSASDTYSWSTASIASSAFANKLPNRSRSQAIKEAFLKTWFNNQAGVSFAWRTLHQNTTSSGTITTPWVIDTDNWTVLSSSTPSTWTTLAAAPPNSGEGTPLVPAQFHTYCQMTSSSAFADQEAGLTKAQLNCQQHFVILLTDGQPNTDGPIEGASSFPYLSNTTSKLVFDGNALVKPDLTKLDRPNNYWNNATLAAVAAHGGQRSTSTATDWIKDPSLVTYPTTAQPPSKWAPFWIQKRKFGGTSGADYTLQDNTLTTVKPHPIQTMTVGVSLSCSYTKADGTTAWPDNTMPDATAKKKPIQNDLTAGKFRLLMTALCGDPGPTNLDGSNVKPYYRNGADKAGDAVYFFDGTTPQTLVDSLGYAFDDIKNMSSVNTTAAPVIPFVGMGLSQQIYITRFIPSSVSTNPVWLGDLSMFSTKQSGNTLQILDKTGAAVTNLDESTPSWSADDALRDNRSWSQRNVWTRLSNGTSLVRFTPFSSAFDAIKGSVATSLTTDAAKQQLIAWNLGADVNDAAFLISTPPVPNPACPNRKLTLDETTHQPVHPGDILGDIINSTPASVEYTLTPWIISQLPPKLSAQVTAAGSATPHFRVIFVGTNRGFMHAFGEVSYTLTTISPGPPVVTTKIVKGDVDELWAFMPTDFLGKLDTIGPSYSGKHRYTVDGDPYVWFLDVPAADAVSGNSMIDYDNTSSTKSEKAILVFGLKKGGRSYYGLNIQNPFTPSLAWGLVPDESASMTAANNIDADAASTVNITSLKSIVGKMGFSSCIPAVGRVLLGSTAKVRDAIFLGGGYSTPEVEAKYTGTPAMGRSALALDVRTGKAFAAWDGSSLGMGPVASGLVPFEFFSNSGLVQRAYFTDYKGGLWALGSGKTNSPDTSYTGPYGSFRRDTSRLDQWTTDGASGSALQLRQVYQDSGKSWRDTTGSNNAIYSMRPAPFLIGNYPGLATWTYSGSPVATNPATVGIAVVSGDRDNPLDKNYTTTTIPAKHRLTVIFDRQDSARAGIGLTGGLIKDTNLSDFTSQTTAPASNWLNDSGGSTKFGYYLNFPISFLSGDGNRYVPKGIYEPIVLNKVLFYSYFTPSSCTCSGGNGDTYTNRICDVMFPAWPGNGVDAATTPAGCNSGRVATWLGVSSPLGVMSTAAAIQAGIKNFSADPQHPNLGIEVKVFEGQLHDKYPKTRTWRTVR